MSTMTTSLSLIWKYSLKGKRNVLARAPVINGTSLYAVFSYSKGGFYESSLTCFDMFTGEVRWEFLVDHVCNQPILDVMGNVYLSSFEGNIYAINADGQQLWRSPDARQNMFMPCLGTDGSLTVAEIGGGSKNTWCLESETGRVRWKFENGGHSYSIAAGDGRIVHATARRNAEGVTLNCLSLKDGRILWTCTSPEYLFKPCIVGTTVFIGARGSLRAYDLETGKLLDRLEMAPEVTLNSEILIHANQIYLSDDNGNLMAIAFHESKSLFGKKLRLTSSWAFKCDSEASARPVAEQHSVFFLSKQGIIHVLDAASGEEEFKLSVGTGDDVGGLALSNRQLVAAHGRELRIYSF
jgi:outer membrane protein assembly factor BamB